MSRRPDVSRTVQSTSRPSVQSGGSKTPDGWTDAPGQAEAAHALRQLLRAVQAGEITAKGPQARAALHRLEGAVTALEAAAPAEPHPPPSRARRS
jgi:hypothetical protein